VVYHESVFDPMKTRQVLVPIGPTLAQIVADEFDAKPEELRIFVDDLVVESEEWATTAPRSRSLVRVQRVPGDWALWVFIAAIVISISLSIAGAVTGNQYLMIAGAAVGLVGMGFGTAAALGVGGLTMGLSGSMSAATVAAGGFALGAAGLVGSVIAKPPRSKGADAGVRSSPHLRGARNAIRTFEPVPRILGKVRCHPSYGQFPYANLEGEHTYFYARLIVGTGPLLISNIRIGDTDIINYGGAGYTKTMPDPPGISGTNYPVGNYQATDDRLWLHTFSDYGTNLWANRLTTVSIQTVTDHAVWRQITHRCGSPYMGTDLPTDSETAYKIPEYDPDDSNQTFREWGMPIDGVYYQEIFSHFFINGAQRAGAYSTTWPTYPADAEMALNTTAGLVARDDGAGTRGTFLEVEFTDWQNGDLPTLSEMSTTTQGGGGGLVEGTMSLPAARGGRSCCIEVTEIVSGTKIKYRPVIEFSYDVNGLAEAQSLTILDGNAIEYMLEHIGDSNATLVECFRLNAPLGLEVSTNQSAVGVLGEDLDMDVTMGFPGERPSTLVPSNRVLDELQILLMEFTGYHVGGSTGQHVRTSQTSTKTVTLTFGLNGPSRIHDPDMDGFTSAVDIYIAFRPTQWATIDNVSDEFGVNGNMTFVRSAKIFGSNIAETLASTGVNYTFRGETESTQCIRATLPGEWDTSSQYTVTIELGGHIAFEGDQWQWDVKVEAAEWANIHNKLYANNTSWNGITSHLEGDAVNETELAEVSLRVRASDIFDGVLDTVNCETQSLFPYYDGDAWVAPTAETTDFTPFLNSNPAWAIADVLRGNGGIVPVDDKYIDGDRLKTFSEWCEGPQADVSIPFTSSPSSPTAGTYLSTYYMNSEFTEDEVWAIHEPPRLAGGLYLFSGYSQIQVVRSLSTAGANIDFDNGKHVHLRVRRPESAKWEWSSWSFVCRIYKLSGLTLVATETEVNGSSQTPATGEWVDLHWDFSAHSDVNTTDNCYIVVDTLGGKISGGPYVAWQGAPYLNDSDGNENYTTTVTRKYQLDVARVWVGDDADGTDASVLNKEFRFGLQTSDSQVVFYNYHSGYNVAGGQGLWSLDYVLYPMRLEGSTRTNLAHTPGNTWTYKKVHHLKVTDSSGDSHVVRGEANLYLDKHYQIDIDPIPGGDRPTVPWSKASTTGTVATLTGNVLHLADSSGFEVGDFIEYESSVVVDYPDGRGSGIVKSIDGNSIYLEEPIKYTEPFKYQGWCNAMAVATPANKPLEVNAVIDYVTTQGDLLEQIASVGMASISFHDGRVGVTIDRPRYDENGNDEAAVAMITPRNTKAFSLQGQRTYPEIAHAIRVNFNDDAGSNRETIVYRAGYGDDALDGVKPATIFETMDTWGVTNADQAYQAGKFSLISRDLRSEIIVVELDIENFFLERGDLVEFCHDVPMIGTNFARISGVTGSGSVTGLDLDEAAYMEDGLVYGVRIRQADGAITYDSVVNSAPPGGSVSTKSISLGGAIPTANGPAVGDVLSFGQLAAETKRMIVVGIMPTDDLAARVTLVDEANGIWSALEEESTFAPVFSTGTRYDGRTLPGDPVIVSWLFGPDFIDLIVAPTLLSHASTSAFEASWREDNSWGTWSNAVRVTATGQTTIRIPWPYAGVAVRYPRVFRVRALRSDAALTSAWVETGAIDPSEADAVFSPGNARFSHLDVAYENGSLVFTWEKNLGDAVGDGLTGSEFQTSTAVAAMSSEIASDSLDGPSALDHFVVGFKFSLYYEGARVEPPEQPPPSLIQSLTFREFAPDDVATVSTNARNAGTTNVYITAGTGSDFRMNVPIQISMADGSVFEPVALQYLPQPSHDILYLDRPFPETGLIPDMAVGAAVTQSAEAGELVQGDAQNIVDPGTSSLLRTAEVYTTESRFEYTLQMNAQDLNPGPSTSRGGYRFVVAPILEGALVPGEPAEILAFDEPPALPSLQSLGAVDGGLGLRFRFKENTISGPDVDAIYIWSGTTEGFALNESSLVYAQATERDAVIPFPSAGTHYYRFAAADAFHRNPPASTPWKAWEAGDLNVSASRVLTVQPAISTASLQSESVTARNTSSLSADTYAGTYFIEHAGLTTTSTDTFDAELTWTGEVFKSSTHATNDFAPLFRIDRYENVGTLQDALASSATSADFVTGDAEDFLEAGDVVSFASAYLQHVYLTVDSTSGSTVNFTGTVGIAVPDASYIRKIHASPLNVRGAPYGDLNVHQGFSYSVVEKGVTAGTHLYRFMLAHDGNSIWQGTKGAAGTRFDAKAVKR